MLRRQTLATVQFALMTFLFMLATADRLGAQTNSTRSVSGPAGLLIDRLKPKDLNRWKLIEKLVFAENENREPLHPTLRALWEWIDTSGHAVYIELVRVNRASSGTAGNFSIERFDPRGEKHVGVIKINLPNIDLAYVGPTAARPNGFIPFTNLDREERYAEVLGHEMAHAVYILANLERTRMVLEFVERTNDMLLSQHIRRKAGWIAPELRQRLSKRDALLKELETQAEMMEVIVWKELNKTKTSREKEKTTQ